MKMFPETNSGKISVILTVAALLVLILFLLFKLAGVVDFDQGHIWDVTVGVIVIVEFTAFVLSLFAIRKEKTVLTYGAVFIGCVAILFLLTHSLFIND